MCDYCKVESGCHYPYKPCDCVHQRKFWSAERRAEFNIPEEMKISAELEVKLDKAIKDARATVADLEEKRKVPDELLHRRFDI